MDTVSSSEQPPANQGAVPADTVTQLSWGAYVSGDADFHFVGGVSWGCAPPWGPGPPASAAPLEEASGALGPRPLSAQSRTRHDPHPHTSYHSSDSIRRGIGEPTRPSQPPALPCLEAAELRQG